METVLDILAGLKQISDVKDLTVVLCVDGLENLSSDGTMTCDYHRVLGTLCQFLNSSRAFAVCICSTKVHKLLSEALAGSGQVRVYLEPSALRAEEILKPRTRLEQQLVDDMGGHGRALEALQDVLQRHHNNSVKEVDPATLVDEVYDALKTRYQEVFESRLFEDPTNCQEVMAAILSRRVYCEIARIGRTDVTVDELRSLGLFRCTRERRLECAFVCFVILMKKTLKKIGEADDMGEYLASPMLGWERFEDFLAFYRRVKSIAFCKTPVTLYEFHAGARFGAIDGVWIKGSRLRTVVKAINQHDVNSCSKDSTFLSNHHENIDASEVKTTVLKRAGASAGGICTRVELITGTEQTHCNEVIQCIFTEATSEALYENERANAVNCNTDVFLLITSADVVDQFDLPRRCGIVSKREFDKYFGPFASRAYRMLLESTKY